MINYSSQIVSPVCAEHLKWCHQTRTCDAECSSNFAFSLMSHSSEECSTETFCSNEETCDADLKCPVGDGTDIFKGEPPLHYKVSVEASSPAHNNEILVTTILLWSEYPEDLWWSVRSTDAYAGSPDHNCMVACLRKIILFPMKIKFNFKIV